MHISKKILLLNLPFEKFYEKTNIKGVAPTAPPLSLACLAGSLLKKGHTVRIFDFNIHDDEKFLHVFSQLNPDFLGITFVTPLIDEANRIAKNVKNINDKTIIIAGGPHCSSFPEYTLKETIFDIVAIGEGDFTIQEIVEGKNLSEIKSIAYKDNGTIHVNKRKNL